MDSVKTMANTSNTGSILWCSWAIIYTWHRGNISWRFSRNWEADAENLEIMFPRYWQRLMNPIQMTLCTLSLQLAVNHVFSSWWVSDDRHYMDQLLSELREQGSRFCREFKKRKSKECRLDLFRLISVFPKTIADGKIYYSNTNSVKLTIQSRVHGPLITTNDKEILF